MHGWSEVQASYAKKETPSSNPDLQRGFIINFVFIN